VELGLASRFGRLLDSGASVEISEVSVPKLGQLVRQSDVIVDDSRGDGAIRGPVLLIKSVEVNNDGIGGDNSDIVGAADAVLRLNTALLAKISVFIIVSNFMGLVFVVLFSGLNEPCTGIDVFSVMGINLAATGSIM
jgi:hypothetical protein